MPRRYSTRRGGMRPVINSIKNIVENETAIVATGITLSNIAIAKDSPLSTVANNVSHGSIIKAIWLSLDFCGLAGSGALQKTACYLIKNPGANLTAPGAFTVGTSNEKKFVIKQWESMTMRNQDGNPPYHWEGWIRIPKRYQRMGTDDLWQFGFETSTLTAHGSYQAIYKWYR